MDIYTVCRVAHLTFLSLHPPRLDRSAAFQSFDFFAPPSLYSIWFVSDIRPNAASQRLRVWQRKKKRDCEKECKENGWRALFSRTFSYKARVVWSCEPMCILWQLSGVVWGWSVVVKKEYTCKGYSTSTISRENVERIEGNRTEVLHNFPPIVIQLLNETSVDE